MSRSVVAQKLCCTVVAGGWRLHEESGSVTSLGCSNEYVSYKNAVNTTKLGAKGQGQRHKAHDSREIQRDNG